MEREAIARVQGRLLAWFGLHRRDLPWRQDRSPYAVLVAEVMSLQTRAETIGPALARFLRRFPDLRSLAAAQEQDVLAAWQGLGYYGRARNLWRAARALPDGEVPSDARVLRGLPGVGPYVAGAVASFAFGRDVAAFDANAARVLARLCDLEAVDAGLAQDFVPAGRAAEWNEAVMDLGALVCVPRRPRCGLCPLADLCGGRRAGRAERLPLRPVARPRVEVEVTTLAVRDGAGRFGLVQRPPAGLLAGLWEFPSLEVDATASAVAQRHGLALRGQVWPLPPFRHTFTHRLWRVRPYAATGSGPLRWVRAGELPQVPLAGPSARLAAGPLPEPAN